MANRILRRWNLQNHYQAMRERMIQDRIQLLLARNPSLAAQYQHYGYVRANVRQSAAAYVDAFIQKEADA